MPFDDLPEFARPGFDLPVLGRTYRVEAPSAKDGIWLQALMDSAESQMQLGGVSQANRAVLSDDQERSTYQMAMGSAYDEMVAAGVPWPVLKHAGITAVFYWTRSPRVAEAHWARFQTPPGQLSDHARDVIEATGVKVTSHPDGSTTLTGDGTEAAA